MVLQKGLLQSHLTGGSISVSPPGVHLGPPSSGRGLTGAPVLRWLGWRSRLGACKAVAPTLLPAVGPPLPAAKPRSARGAPHLTLRVRREPLCPGGEGITPRGFWLPSPRAWALQLPSQGLAGTQRLAWDALPRQGRMEERRRPFPRHPPRSPRQAPDLLFISKVGAGRAGEAPGASQGDPDAQGNPVPGLGFHFHLRLPTPLVLLK